MKKIYWKPEMEFVEINVIGTICAGSTDKDTDDDDNPFGAPRKHAPAF